MATLNESQSSKAVKGRSQKSTPRVDLTAMVDLMFLLTTFFMLTTTLGDLNVVDVAKPEQSLSQGPYPASRTMTILLGKNGETAYYMGEPDQAEIKTSPLKNIEGKILSSKLLMAKTHNNNPLKHLIVIIKPTKTSTYKDFVDVLDEMKITNVKAYAIDDDHITPAEQAFIKLKGI
ncbi:biopolymer transporter ExbD [Pedobacter yonginense]|uniref:Biopolymer transporter ExbD n=1 Tax=Pedobacter yonginense TaxID=651869 RepID=A0A317ES40_9SPHI|nr:biopolymer transporter ExbD [Pedobacter yonginense]PWS28076.1 biopolymer transporter ExbD [Pedobacter yonginense]